MTSGIQWFPTVYDGNDWQLGTPRTSENHWEPLGILVEWHAKAFDNHWLTSGGIQRCTVKDGGIQWRLVHGGPVKADVDWRHPLFDPTGVHRRPPANFPAAGILLSLLFSSLSSSPMPSSSIAPFPAVHAALDLIAISLASFILTSALLPLCPFDSERVSPLFVARVTGACAGVVFVLLNCILRVLRGRWGANSEPDAEAKPDFVVECKLDARKLLDVEAAAGCPPEKAQPS
ncbi:hypothetical protein B0H11DRAFT_2205774 [Mycena galericulata]|nr:hypothetical protein B0H11DRAFT_2205774 [Mycena galericulata]